MNSSASTVSAKSKIKIVLLGNQSVGKSCIIDRYVNERFDETSNPTVGIDFLAKNVTYKNKNYRLQIWDTAGQQRFKSLIPGYLRDAHCSLIVFDVTSKSTLNSVDAWLHLYQDHKTGESFTILIANKIDLDQARQVSESEGKSKANQLGLLYHEVSAKTGQNLEKLFEQIVQIFVRMSLDGAFKSTKKESHTIQEVEQEQDRKERPIIRQQQQDTISRIKLKKNEKKLIKEEKCC